LRKAGLGLTLQHPKVTNDVVRVKEKGAAAVAGHRCLASNDSHGQTEKTEQGVGVGEKQRRREVRSREGEMVESKKK